MFWGVRRAFDLQVQQRQHRHHHRKAVQLQQQHLWTVDRQQRERRCGLSGGPDPGGPQPSDIYLLRAAERNEELQARECPRGRGIWKGLQGHGGGEDSKSFQEWDGDGGCCEEIEP